MNVCYDLEAGDVIVNVTESDGAFRWDSARRYGVAHDPVRGRVGAVVVPHPSKKPLRIEQKAGEVVVYLRLLRWGESIVLDNYVTIELDDHGVVMTVRITQ